MCLFSLIVLCYLRHSEKKRLLVIKPHPNPLKKRGRKKYPTRTGLFCIVGNLGCYYNPMPMALLNHYLLDHLLLGRIRYGFDYHSNTETTTHNLNPVRVRFCYSSTDKKSNKYWLSYSISNFSKNAKYSSLKLLFK